MQFCGKYIKKTDCWNDLNPCAVVILVCHNNGGNNIDKNSHALNNIQRFPYPPQTKIN